MTCWKNPQPLSWSLKRLAAAARSRSQRPAPSALSQLERRLRELDRVEAERRLDVPGPQLAHGDRHRLDAVPGRGRHDHGARDPRRLEQPALALEHRVARVERAGLQQHTAAKRRIGHHVVAVELHAAHARDPLRVDVDPHGYHVRCVGTRHRGVDAHVAIALVPHGGAQPRECRVQRDQIERRARLQHDRALQLLRREHGRSLRHVQRPDARRLTLDDAKRHRHSALRRHEHRVHLRVAESALPVVDAQLGDVLAERGRCRATPVAEQLRRRELAERHEERQSAARRAREHDALEIVRRHRLRAGEHQRCDVDRIVKPHFRRRRATAAGLSGHDGKRRHQQWRRQKRAESQGERSHV